MKLYLIRNDWRGQKYLKEEDGNGILAFESEEEANEHIEWEIDCFPTSEKPKWRDLLTVVEIDVPDVRGIDP